MLSSTSHAARSSGGLAPAIQACTNALHAAEQLCKSVLDASPASNPTPNASVGAGLPTSISAPHVQLSAVQPRLQQRLTTWQSSTPCHHPFALGGLRSWSSGTGDKPGSSDAPSSGGGNADGGQAGGDTSRQVRVSLQEALTRVVDAAVEMVEQGAVEEAVNLLKEGIATFEPSFPDSPELGELHNQVALLSLVGGDADTAAHHAEQALAITRKHFSETGALVGHRKLRLGVAQFAQGHLTDAAGNLHGALEALTAAGDASRFEARFYFSLSVLSGTRDVQQVSELTERLLSDVSEMKGTFGGDSMIVSLALAQHDRVAHQALAAQAPDTLLCEALLKQHARLIEACKAEGEDLAMEHYKLATFYYVHDMLPEAQNYVRRAGTGLRAVLPEEHALVAMCKHRLGMVCAVLGDHRAATQLLETSKAQLTAGSDTATEGSPGAVSGLAREADLGLAIAKFKAMGPGGDEGARRAALDAVRARLDELAAAIGVQHMLTQGAMRHFAKMKAMARV